MAGQDPAVLALIDNGWLGEWDSPVGVDDLVRAVELVRATDAANGSTGSPRALAEWLVTLDDPGGPGAAARRSVTLTQIINRARAALDHKE